LLHRIVLYGVSFTVLSQSSVLAAIKFIHSFIEHIHYPCGSLAQCALSLKRLSAGPGFNPQTRQNKFFQDYWRACFEINFSDRQQGLTVSSIICDR